MNITVAPERMLLYSPQLGFDQAQATAWDKKLTTFDPINRVGSFFSRPKDEDFELVYKEFRYQPFWHIVAKAHYVYDRSATYQVTVSGPEVQSATHQATDFKTTNGHIHLPVVEHCTQDEQEEVLVEAVTGKPDLHLKRYLSFTPKVISGKLEDQVGAETILVPPQTRVSALMRDTLAKMIKGIQADTILEEAVMVNTVDLYYHPIYAFQYRWQSKNKEAIVEIDGLTGEVDTGNRTFKEYLGKVLDQNFLFDLGADAAGMFIPGGSIAVKIAKKYIDLQKPGK